MENHKTNTDNDETVSNFATVVFIVSSTPQQHVSSKNKVLKNNKHSEILTSTPMKAVFDEKKRKIIKKDSKTKAVQKNKKL